MATRILLVNPPIYDFTAYDFWLKPYGLLTVGGWIRNKAELFLFDFLDRQSPFMAKMKSDKWSRGPFPGKDIPKPDVLKNIPRKYRRFGLSSELFSQYLTDNKPFDFVLIQTVMTYWYPGYAEVIETIRRVCPKTKIILGGPYASLCPEHAENLGADMVAGADLEPLWRFINIEPDKSLPPFWQGYKNLDTAVIKLTSGCPFKCTYCSVPMIYSGFRTKKLAPALAELDLILARGAKNIAFYDDALLYKSEEVFVPFLNELIRRKIKINLHSPNALNARFITAELAELMVRAGFKTFYLGFESISEKWQKQTGSKVFPGELANAVRYLRNGGAAANEITAYQILGHPSTDVQQLEESMRYANSLGIQTMLADFSPIPNTPDWIKCGEYIDISEPLMHNKTAFPIILLGEDETNRLKDMCRALNRSLWNS